MVKLTKKAADIIIRRYFPHHRMEVTKGPDGERTYKAQNGYLNITITNDWFDRDGLISVYLSNALGDGTILVKLDPVSLEPVVDTNKTKSGGAAYEKNQT